MSLRSKVGSVVTAIAGEPRLQQLRHTEESTRRRLATWLDQGRSAPVEAEHVPGPAAEHPAVRFTPPQMTRHQFLEGLHSLIQPRTYLEIGVNDGRSLALSRAKSIGIDPEFGILTELECDLQLARTTSDEFFARADPLRHFGGLPIDLAFIDGMHLAEFAYRDFVNVERLMSPTGVIVLDDMLPRSVEEAARDRQTFYWAGDVFKVAEILREARPDLVIVPVNTAPTGVLLVTALDPSSRDLDAQYATRLEQLQSSDPQRVSRATLDRIDAVQATSVLRSRALPNLLELRHDTVSVEQVRNAVRGLRQLRKLGEPAA
ncbi:class I SAM-dependent methyltransferase [Plantibacter sp. YIM 135249]|uniref:class I SAM-dependent methyltransferase n=1 Tax=Plantibacter sp. YIM 135249 TaxID=3423918 RepID=UPI003D34098B